MPPPADLPEAEGPIQPLGGAVRVSHLQKHCAHPALAEQPDNRLDKRASHALSSSSGRHADVQDLSFIHGMMSDDIADHATVGFGNEKWDAPTNAVFEVA